MCHLWAKATQEVSGRPDAHLGRSELLACGRARAHLLLLVLLIEI